MVMPNWAMLLAKYARGLRCASTATSADTLITPQCDGEQPLGPCASMSEMPAM